MMRPVTLCAGLALLTACNLAPELPNVPPEACPADYVAACDALASACLKSEVCRLKLPDPSPACLPGCVNRQRRCYAESTLDIPPPFAPWEAPRP